MKLLERTPEHLVLGLGNREKTFLERLLACFPLNPKFEPALSRTDAGQLTEAEGLLRESLRERNDELSQWLRRHFAEGETMRRTTHGWRLTLTFPQAESLLQVLNELRVTAWTRLGCPEKFTSSMLNQNPGSIALFSIMTEAGEFQMELVHALDLQTGASLPPAETGIP